MKNAPLPDNELSRLKALQDHQLLDSLPEEIFDDITHLASEIMGTPVASINLVDENRQWHKSKYGLDLSEMPREYSFCAHAILNPTEVLVIPDARYDERFHDNPYVTGDLHIAFYAGVPILDAAGHALGALCVIDNRSRDMPEHKLKSFRALGKLVNAHFALRKAHIELEALKDAEVKKKEQVHSILKRIEVLHNTPLTDEQKQQLQIIQDGLISLTGK